jgi:cation diffusion facilitator CzcD-associated flavoprotein CzcO
MQKKYLIIGTSAAGLAAAHKIRQLDKEGILTCFTKEKEVWSNAAIWSLYVNCRDNCYFFGSTNSRLVSTFKPALLTGC